MNLPQVSGIPGETFAHQALQAAANKSSAADELLVGFLLVGHGTRRTAGQEQLRTVFIEFAAQLSPYPAALGFLELAEPDIASAVAEMAKKGVQRLITVPVLLFSAGHAEEDIPQAVAEAARQHGIGAVTQVPPLECCQPILDLSARRYREAVCGAECRRLEPVQPVAMSTVAHESPAPAEDCSGYGNGSGYCSGKYCPQVALLMLGRGSSSLSATAEMRRFTELRVKQTPAAWHQTGFIHAQQPDVKAALDQLSASDLPIAVVQPHLLFEGELIDSLRREVAERQRQQPDRRWIITETLGTDASLAKTLAEVGRSGAK